MTLKGKFARARHPLLFLALLIPAIAGQLALAQDQPGPDYGLVIDVYSGAVPPDATQEKAFWLWLETVKKTEDPGGLPKVIHLERVLSEKEFDIAEQGEVNGEKVVVQGHVSRQVDGNLSSMRSGADYRIRNRTRFTTLRMGLDGKVVASGFHLFDLRQVISIVDLNLGNRSVANDVENVLRTDRVVSPGLLNVILLVELSGLAWGASIVPRLPDTR